MNKFKHLLLIGMILNILLALVLPATIGTAGPVFAAGATYYVATTGSDSNPGTQASPWKTIQKAANTVIAGDTVYVRGGVYKEYVNIKTLGTLAKPVVYSAYPGEFPIIDTTGLPDPGWSGIVTLYGARYVTVSGFEIRNTLYEMGVYVTGATGGSSNIALVGLKIHDVAKSGIYVEITNNLLIDGCEVYKTNSIYLSDEQVSIVGVNNFEIKNCSFHNCITENGLCCKGGSSNGSIHDNEIYGSNDTTTGIYVGNCDSLPEDNYKIYNNRIHDCTSAGIVLGSEESPYASVTNIDIYNNLIYNNSEGFCVWAHPFTRSFRIINNVFYNNGDEIAVYGSGSTAGVNQNCIIRNNILVAFSNENLILLESTTGGIPAIDHNLYFDPTGAYNFQPTNILGTNYVKANPLFVNPPTDFRLQAGSPAINAGSATLAPSTDFIGTIRPQGAAYDIGAYEYAALNPSPTPTPTPTPITGDINGDGVVNSTDLVKLMRILMGLDPVTSSVDVNGDGNIDAHDITPELIIMRGLE